MKLEDQVITLEQAKKLQELGVKAESIFNHSIGWVQGSFPDRYLLAYGGFEAEGQTERYSAYTVAELGEMLPYQYLNTAAKEARRIDNNAIDYVGFWKGQKFWKCRYTEGEKPFIFSTEAQARAAMLIYLLENNLIPNQ